MSTHTPGPWKFEIEKKDKTWPGEYIVRTDILSFGLDGEEGIYINNPADARLIAAAPDLLAALKQLMEAWPEGEACMEPASTAFDKAYEALDKAEGKRLAEGM